MARPVATSAVFVLWVAAACGGSPAPTAPAPQTALPILAKPGIWTGTLDVTACSDSRSRCPAHITDWPQTFSLRMAADGLALSALVETPLLAVPVMLTGSVAPDGSARLAGSYQSSRASGDLRGIEVTELHLRPDPVTGVTGTFAFRHDYTSTVTTLAGTVASASQRPFADTASRPFQGTWSGLGVMTACTGDCSLYESGRNVTVTLRATQVGTDVSGDLSVFIAGLPVSGSVSGAELVLSGEARFAITGGTGTSYVRLDRFAATTDALGRLRGTLRFYREGMRSGTKAEGFGLVRIAETTDVQLAMVVRQF